METIMLAYATIGTNDLPRAANFYDALLAEVGGKRFMEEPGSFIAWGSSETGAGLGVTIPFDKKPACVGNGCMVALQAGSREQGDRLHARALELGGTDEGAPGQRSEGFYAAYFRDLDGNKLNACFMG
jgi:catechol 2,3-dioxygenase-like lactoylglutathione lyase family enzyme